MLIGDLRPTHGDAHIYGYSILHQMDKIREFMGVCPQFVRALVLGVVSSSLCSPMTLHTRTSFGTISPVANTCCTFLLPMAFTFVSRPLTVLSQLVCVHEGNCLEGPF
jgi:Na+/glutamate symporter